MNIVVMGAGAVGGYFGGRLAQAGHAVTFVARGAHLRALQSHGLQLSGPSGAQLQHVTAVAEPSAAGEAELVLFTVKAQHSEEAARLIAPLMRSVDARVLTLQNGVDGVDVLRDAFGDGRVFGGVAYIEAVLARPGEVVRKSPFARIVFGPLAGPDPRASRVLEAFREAGVEATLEREPMAAVWRKWLLICAFSGLTALTRRPIGAIVACPETRHLLRRAMEEISDLAAARGVQLPAQAVDGAMAMVGETFEPTMTSSLAQDLAAGKPLELDALNGAASRLGRELAVATPVNDLIYAALVLHKDGRG